MTKKHTVSYDARSFILDGERVLLTSGSLHYFRVPRDLWRDRLEKAKSFGLNCIQTYVAWNVHEPHEEEYRFDGDADLSAFFSLCEELGLYVIARPGPYICAEWDFGGFPAWLLTKPDILIRRYGLHGRERETLEKIGQVHNLTRERIRQIEAKALEKIQKHEGIKKLKDY